MNRTQTFLLFIGIALTVYTLLNTYFIFKSRHLIHTRNIYGTGWILFLCIAYLLPVATMVLPRFTETKYLPIISYPGYSWLAFLFLFLSWHLITDLILIIPKRLNLFSIPDPSRLFTAVSLFCAVILVYSFFEARNIKVEQIEIASSKLSGKMPSITIAQISDVHFSALAGEKTALAIKKKLAQIRPDILVMTGDMIDHGLNEKEQVLKVFKSITPPMGKIAVTGNHEFIAGIENTSAFIKKGGFNLLRNESIVINNEINIVGRDDISASQFIQASNTHEVDLFNNLDKSRFTLFLKHQPKVEPETIPYFDLMLSGHTHAGQIFPFNWMVKAVFTYTSGLYKLSKETKLYVNRGTGTWGPPFRFLTTPEISVFKVTREDLESATIVQNN